MRIVWEDISKEGEIMTDREIRDRLVELMCEVKHYESDDLTYNDIENIADYLIANGVIVPPCKVGYKVYCLYQECQKETKIIELEIDTFEIHKDYTIINGYCGEHCYRYFTHEIGKTVFLTKEEAKKKLEELRGNVAKG